MAPAMMSGRAVEGHHPGHDGGQADHQRDDAGHLGGFQDDPRQVLEGEALVDQAQHGGIGHGHGGGLGGGEHALHDAHDDDDDEQQGGNGVQHGLESLPDCIGFLDDIAALFRADAGQRHDHDAPDDPGQVARHEQRRHGHAARDGGVDDHQVGGRDQHPGGGRRRC